MVVNNRIWLEQAQNTDPQHTVTHWMTVKMPSSLSSGSIAADRSLMQHLFLFVLSGPLWRLSSPPMRVPVLAPDAKVSPCSIRTFHRQLSSACLCRSVMIAYSAAVQVSGRCPEGGDRACRFCLSNEITSHSGPVHQKTQRDQCWTAGLQWDAAPVEAASVSRALMENMFCLVKNHLQCFHVLNSPIGQRDKRFLGNWGKYLCSISTVLFTTSRQTTERRCLKY